MIMELEWDGAVRLEEYRYRKAWLEKVTLTYLTSGIPWKWVVVLVYGYEPGMDPAEDVSCRGDPTSELHYIGPSEGEEDDSSNRVLGHSRVIDLGGPFPLRGWWSTSWKRKV